MRKNAVMESTIAQLISTHLKPTHMDVINESHKHHNHAGSPNTGHSHFKLVVVSDLFAHKNKLERQRQVNTVLAPCFTAGLHALSMRLYTPAEWEKRQHTA